MNGLASLKTALRVNLAFKTMQKFNPSKNLWKKAMKETLQFNLNHLFTKICQIKPHSVLYQQNNCYTSTEVQSYQHHKMLFTSTSIYSHLGAEIVSKHLWFWPSEQFWYQRYLPSLQKENIIAWFITVIWITKYWKLLSEKIIIPLLRLIFLNYMNQKLKPL